MASEMTRLPPLESLRIFAVAARHLSFTKAAGELNLTQSAVSHRVKALEEELGVILFNRLVRRLELTGAGAALAHTMRQAIHHIERGVAELDRTGGALRLSITMLPSVASRWFVPRLTRFRKRRPDIEVQVIAEPRLLDLRAEGIDLALRFGRGLYPGYAVTAGLGVSGLLTRVLGEPTSGNDRPAHRTEDRPLPRMVAGRGGGDRGGGDAIRLRA
jgi:LysR family transcriptional regulator, glycine cleavage system transcriptional activator